MSEEMRISSVEVLEERAGFVIKNWSGVEQAIRSFATNEQAEKSLQDLLFRTDLNWLGQHLNPRDSTRAKTFVSSSLQDAKRSIRKYRGWFPNFDYKGTGTLFYKTNINLIKLAGRGGYWLELLGDHITPEIKDELSKTLGIRQGLRTSQVKLGLEPEGERFRFNFDQVVERLQPVLETFPSSLSGTDIATYFMDRAGPDFRIPEKKRRNFAFVLGSNRGIELVLDVKNISMRFEYQDHDTISADRWQQKGGVITGPLRIIPNKLYRTPDDMRPLLSISAQQEPQIYPDPSFITPVLDPKLQTYMRGLANQVAGCFK